MANPKENPSQSSGLKVYEFPSFAPRKDQAQPSLTLEQMEELAKVEKYIADGIKKNHERPHYTLDHILYRK